LNILKPRGVKRPYVRNAALMSIGRSVGTAKMGIVTTIAVKILVVAVILIPM